MKNNIYDKLIEIKNGNHDSLEEIISILNPLIHKYSRLLDGEDTKQDLTIYLISLINKIPINKETFFENNAILAYISKSIKNEYIKLSKKHDKKRNNEIKLDLNIDMGYEELESEIEMLDLFNVLTLKEAYIMKLIYLNYLSVTEVSEFMKISRQSVNQTKNRALNKLKKLYSL